MSIGGFDPAASKSSPGGTGTHTFIEDPHESSGVGAVKQLRLERLCLLNDYRNCSL